jgi:uncharacterized protein YegP (UPF0339 family)
MVSTMVVEIFKSNMNKYPGKKSEWYVRLVAGNGETLNTSEGYATKWNAKRAAKKVFPNLKIEYP